MLNRKLLAVLLLPVMLVNLAACSAQVGGDTVGETGQLVADYPYYETLEELYDKAALVVRGSVEGSRAGYRSSEPIEGADPNEPESGTEVTIFDFTVTEAIRGDVVEGQTIEVMQPGSPEWVAKADDRLLENVDYVLFLVSSDGPTGIVGGPGGTYTVKGDELFSEFYRQAEGSDQELKEGLDHVTLDELKALAER